MARRLVGWSTANPVIAVQPISAPNVCANAEATHPTRCGGVHRGRGAIGRGHEPVCARHAVARSLEDHDAAQSAELTTSRPQRFTVRELGLRYAVVGWSIMSSWRGVRLGGRSQ
jgi:hypothetical protein